MSLTVRSTERASHPVGTTVRVTDFFKYQPVRKQAALKHPAKWLAKIKRIIQAYALARPTVRFSLRVLKAKTDKSNFVYAPKPGANVEDAAFKVVGRDCASQCDWTVLESDGFVIHAFLPKPDAKRAKISNEGYFISVDSRPVSAARGTMKQIAAAFRERLRKANPELASVQEPFLCMNIICPPDSYDPNIEPAKDDVLFKDGELVVSIVNNLLRHFYPEEATELREEPEFRVPSEQLHDCTSTPPFPMMGTQFDVHEDENQQDLQRELSSPSKDSHRWRSNMYGIDEEDMDLISRGQPPIIEDEEEQRQVAKATNPWTIARMNSPSKPRQVASIAQLMTPAKGSGDVIASSSSPMPASMPHVVISTAKPLTPQPSSQANMVRSSTDLELQQSIQRLPSPSSSDHGVSVRGAENIDSDNALLRGLREFCDSSPDLSGCGVFPATLNIQPNIKPLEVGGSTYSSSEIINSSSTPSHVIPTKPSAPRRARRNRQHFENKPFIPVLKQARNANGRYFAGNGNAKCAPRRKKPPSNTDKSLDPRGPAIDNSDYLMDGQLQSEANADIRDFFGTKQNRARQRPRRSVSAGPALRPHPTFTPINQKPDNAIYQLRACSNGVSSFEQADVDEEFRESQDNIRRAQLRRRAANIGQLAQEIQCDTPKDSEPAAHFSRRTRPISRRSTLPHLRTKSSLLPLNHIPRAYKIHNTVLNVSLPLAMSKESPILSISHAMDVLDMQPGINSLEWEYPAPEIFYLDGHQAMMDEDRSKYESTFVTHIEESRIHMWANVLANWYAFKNGEDAMRMFMEGVWRGLSEMERSDQSNEGEIIHVGYKKEVSDGDVGNKVKSHGLTEADQFGDDEAFVEIDDILGRHPEGAKHRENENEVTDALGREDMSVSDEEMLMTI